jgi:hypothetical protein
MKNKHLVLKIFVMILSVNAFAIIDGKPATTNDSQRYSSYITITDTRSNAGGLHIGKGLILTAAHIFYGFYESSPGYQSKMLLHTSNGGLLGGFTYTGANQIIKIESKSSFIDGNGFQIQTPDLAILVPPLEIRKQIIKEIPVAHIYNGTNKISKKAVYQLIGIGDIDFAYSKNPSPKKMNTLRPHPHLGNFCLIANSEYNTEYTFSTEYSASKGCAAGGSGDSGSALWVSESAKDQPQVIGIAHLQIPPDATDTGIGETIFTRIDHPDVQTWIKNILKNLNSRKK